VIDETAGSVIRAGAPSTRSRRAIVSSIFRRHPDLTVHEEQAPRRGFAASPVRRALRA
jgi:hypothetical protein